MILCDHFEALYSAVPAKGSVKYLLSEQWSKKTEIEIEWDRQRHEMRHDMWWYTMIYVFFCVHLCHQPYRRVPYKDDNWWPLVGSSSGNTEASQELRVSVPRKYPSNRKSGGKQLKQFGFRSSHQVIAMMKAPSECPMPHWRWDRVSPLKSLSLWMWTWVQKHRRNWELFKTHSPSVEAAVAESPTEKVWLQHCDTIQNWALLLDKKIPGSSEWLWFSGLSQPKVVGLWTCSSIEFVSQCMLTLSGASLWFLTDQDFLCRVVVRIFFSREAGDWNNPKDA